MMFHKLTGAAALAVVLMSATPACAHKLHERNVAVSVADSGLTVTPSRDWNQLNGRIGKNTETWTLDGGQLNDVTFYGGIAAGAPLVKERDKKHAPLPKFTSETLLVEVPELFERTYRAYKTIASFSLISTEPARFAGQDGVRFTYAYSDDDQLTRQGEARAAIVGGKLYMISFDAPRLNYFGRIVGDFQAIADSATLR
jgi:hypothetical protein